MMTQFLPKGQVWKRVWILEVWSENGSGKWHFLVWNRVWIPRITHPPRGPSLMSLIPNWLSKWIDTWASLLTCFSPKLLPYYRVFHSEVISGSLGFQNSLKNRDKSSTRLEREWCCPEESDKEWQEGCNVTNLILLRGHDNCQSGVLY